MPPVSSLTAVAFSPCMRGEVELDLAGLHPELGQRAMRRFLEQLRAMQQRLRRNAADVEAGPAQRLAGFGAGGLQPQLRRADRGDIAAGAGADDEDVVVVLCQPFRPPSRAGFDKLSLSGILEFAWHNVRSS